MSKYKITFIFFIFGLLTACGGGGGGSVSSSSGCTTCGSYATEYANQYGLGLIGAKTANDSGYTGAGVRVAVNDTGVNGSHSEFDQTSQTGRNFSGSTTSLTDINGHGTHVASIIAGERDTTGMRGVAYDAEIWSYKIFNDSGSATGINTDSKWANTVDYHVTDSIKVSNNSWGTTSVEVDEVNTSWINSNYSNTVSAYKRAINNGTIFVFAAGNNGRIQPNWESGMPYHISDIENGWLAVMAVDENLQETAYTQRCGLAKDWCVAAPGGGDTQSSEGIYAAKSSGGYIRYSGTSMAAPHVSGLLATVFQRFPSLSSSSVRNRILNTATYSGLKTVGGTSASSLTDSQKKAIFGQGIVSYSAATSVIGNLQYVTGDNYFNTNEKIDFKKQKLSIPNLLSNADIKDAEFTVFDSYDGANFTVKGKDLFEIGSSTDQILAFKDSSDLNIIRFNKDNFSNNFSLNFITSGDEGHSLSSNTFWGEKSGFFADSGSFKYGSNINNFDFNLFSNDTISLTSFVQHDEDKSAIDFENFGLSFKSNFNNLSVYSSFSNSKYPLDLSIHENILSDSEQNNLEYGFIFNLNDKLDLFYRELNVDLKNIPSSNLSYGLENAKANSKTLGLTLNENENFKLGVGIYQPQILTSGSINFNKVSGRNPDGTIYYEKTSYSTNYDPNNLPLFLSFSKKIDIDTYIDFSIQQSYFDSNNISNGELKLRKEF